MKIVKTPGALPKLRAAVAGLDGSEGRVGWFPSAKYQDGTPVAGVAAVQEFGSGATPPRSFFRTTNAEKQPAWKATSEKLAKAVIQGKLAPAQLQEGLCLAAEGDVRAKIGKIFEPPLSTITLLARMHRKKGGVVTGKTIGALAAKADAGPQRISGISTKPLVDSGFMLATLTSQVTKK